MKKPLTLFLLVSTLASAGVKTNYFNAQPMVVSNLLVQSGITLGGSNITAWSQIGGTSGTDSNTVNALIAAGTSLNASNWLGWVGASNWLHTAFYPLTLNPSNYVSLAQVWSAGALSNNWTGAAITLDAANANTNTFGGFLVIGPARYQANSATASGLGSWANNAGTATGNGSWANGGATASGIYSWANNFGLAIGNGSWANYGATASGHGSWAMGSAAMATNENTFVWSDGTAVGSDAEKTFTVHAANGIRLLGGPITGNGGNLTGTGTTFTAGNSLALGGVALGGLVPTSRVVSVVINGATNSATLNADAVINLGTITGGTTTDGPAFRWFVDSNYPATTNDNIGFANNSVLPSQASVTSQILDGPTCYNYATNNWAIDIALTPIGSAGSNLQYTVLRSGDSSVFTSNHTVFAVWSNRVTGAGIVSSIFTNTIVATGTRTNITISSPVLTNSSGVQVIFRVWCSATNNPANPALFILDNHGARWN